MSLFGNMFRTILENFDNLQGKRPSDKAKEPFHQKVSRGMQAMHQGKAKRYTDRLQGDGTSLKVGELNPKIEQIRNGEASIVNLNDLDEQYILKNFPPTEMPREAGKPIKIGGFGVVFYDAEMGIHRMKAI